MQEHVDVSIGQRVAALRKLRGLTQEGFALRLNRSASWVAKVERGARRIDSMAVIQELARTLAVAPRELTGGLDAAIFGPGAQTVDGLADLKRVLDRSGMIHSDAPDAAIRGSDELNREGADLRRLYNTAPRSFSLVVPRLSSLIDEANRATAQSQDANRRTAYSALSAFYRVASLELRQLGDLPRARVAIDRSLHAAERADDLLLVASVSATMVVQLMVQGDADDAIALALDVAGHVRRQPDADSVAGRIVLGALHLYAAQAAARARDASESHRLLKIATEVASSMGRDREELCLIFGPTNVAIQEAGILVDLGDPSRAIERARQVQPERLGSVNRTGYHYLHMARAHGLRGKDLDAVHFVAAAHRVAPDLVQHDPIARELVRDVVRRRRHIDDQLRSLARELRVSP